MSEGFTTSLTNHGREHTYDGGTLFCRLSGVGIGQIGEHLRLLELGVDGLLIRALGELVVLFPVVIHGYGIGASVVGSGTRVQCTSEICVCARAGWNKACCFSDVCWWDPAEKFASLLPFKSKKKKEKKSQPRELGSVGKAGAQNLVRGSLKWSGYSGVFTGNRSSG